MSVLSAAAAVRQRRRGSGNGGLIRRGADTIAFASCIQKGTPIGYPCPFAKKMKEIIANDLGDSAALLDYTH
ncbi:MAG TPA: CGGC domain-containing protein [Candidatus Treponema faecavium]|nr:CGGC domain-containing protein [Candidatus Treponema faecavium]